MLLLFLLPLFVFGSILSEEYDILVLGAGFAGLSAAIQLGKAKNVSFLVLEAKDYIGGRVKNASFGGITVELGANWIHDVSKEPHEYYALAKKYNMRLHPVNYKSVNFIWKNGTQVSNSSKLAAEKEIYNKFSIMQKTIARREKEGRGKVNLRTGLHMVGWVPDTYEKKAAEYYLFDFEHGVAPEYIDASLSSYTGASSGKDFFATDPRGYVYPVLQEARHIRDKILLNHEVTKIERLKNKKYKVHTKDRNFIAKHILVTFSSGVLQSKRITFIPELPAWKTEALSMVPMSHYCKYFFQFNNTFWDTNSEYIVVTGNRPGFFQIWQPFEIKTLYPGKHLLLATLTGETCKEKHSLSDEDLIEEIFGVLKGIYPEATKPKAILRNSWSTDPHVMGAYSSQVSGTNEDDYLALDHPVEASMWFAGEYKGHEDFGYAHKALEIGRKEADLILMCLRDGKCPTLQPKKSLFEDQEANDDDE